MSDEHQQHDGGHELEGLNTGALFKVVVGLTILVFLSSVAVVQWFYKQRDDLRLQRAAQGSIFLKEHRAEIAAELADIDKTIAAVSGDESKLGPGPAPAGWVHPDDVGGAAPADGAAAPAGEAAAGEGEPAEGDAKEGESPEGAAKEGDASEGAAKEGDAKEAGAEKADAQKADAKAGDAKKADAKAGDAKKADAKPANAKKPTPGHGKKEGEGADKDQG